MFSSKCAACDSEKFLFIKNQEASGLINNLGLKAPLSQVSILYNILF